MKASARRTGVDDDGRLANSSSQRVSVSTSQFIRSGC
jgi:hypothetical protein